MGDIIEQVEDELLRPLHINTFALPEDSAVKLAHAVYDATKESLKLKSEKGRSIYAEAFITNPRLGTLADLCARVLAKEYGPSDTFNLSNDPHKQRLQLDAIDIEQPLENIYQIEDTKFWRRLALAKTKNPGLKFKPENFNWKNEGISLKFVELVESCPAEFWPEQKMTELANKIKDFVTDMHIRQLQSLKDYSFDRYMLRDSDTDKTTSTDVSYTTDEEKFRKTNEISKTSIMDEEEVEKEMKEPNNNNKNTDDDIRFSMFQSPLNSTSSSLGSGREDRQEETKEKMRLAEKLRKKTEERRRERRARREAQQRRREKLEEKRQKRKEEANKPKPKRYKVKNVLDLPIEEPIDDEEKKLDKRNLKTYLAHLKSYKYPPEHCHHIDLRFVRYFENLVSFAIEFHPPELREKFHTRHFNFSYEDVQHLASGIAYLQQLRIFRLRDSRMDASKLETLVATLKHMNVETIDFGNDQLNDDCEDALYELFQKTTTIKYLELEGNKLGPYSLRRLGKALKRYGGILKYLGLARNPIDTESLHGLCSKIVNTPQIEEFCLAGVRVSEMGIFCCVADELLQRHLVLRHLDLMAVPLSTRGGELLISAMRKNYNIQSLECRGCNLETSIETDLALCVERNRYIAKNAYIGNNTKTAADIEQFISENKNPILLAASKEVNQRDSCLGKRPDIAERFSSPTSTGSKRSRLTATSLEIEDKTSKEVSETSETTNSEEKATALNKLPFVYNANEFNMEQIHEHVQLPGPGQRYYYFQTKNRIRCAYTD